MVGQSGFVFALLVESLRDMGNRTSIFISQRAGYINPLLSSVAGSEPYLPWNTLPFDQSFNDLSLQGLGVNVV